jgi:hypothetical protein
MKSVSKTPTSGQTGDSFSVHPSHDDEIHGSGANGDGQAPPPSAARPIPAGPQFALRLADGAVLMAIEGHADDRDLAGREVWRAFALTTEESELVRASLDNAGHDVASRIAAKLPKR